MYSKYAQYVSYPGHQKEKLNTHVLKWKQHYHITLDKEFKMDCGIWLDFLSSELSTVVTRPMLEDRLDSFDIGFSSDASAAADLGFGAILQDSWIKGNWPVRFIDEEQPSIEFLELYALCAGIFSWEERLADCNFKIHCDNVVVVHMVNKMVLSCGQCMFLLRLLILNCLKFNRRLTAQYINTKANCLPDALSRNQMTRFHRLGPHMDETPSEISKTIWPISKVWQFKSKATIWT